MPKFLKPGKVVVLLQGRHAGAKAVIVKAYDDGTGAKPYGHCLVVGLSKAPRKVTKKMSEEKLAKKSSVKAFIKLINYTHLMPTRYSLDVDFKGVVSADVIDNKTKKVAAQKECKKLLEEKFKTGKNKWFFTKLRF